MPDVHLPDGSLTVGQRIGLVETTVISHSQRIDALESYRDELRGVVALLKWAFGTSLVSAIVSIAAIITVLSGQKP